MTDAKFQNVIERIYGRYGRKMPLPSVIDDAWNDVQAIPDEAADWILSRLLDLEELPRNWVKSFKSLWNSWREARPERQAYEPRANRGCQFCEGGELSAVMLYPRSAFVAGCPCGHCQPFMASAKTWEQLERSGYHVFKAGLDANEFARKHIHAVLGIVQVNGRNRLVGLVDAHKRAA